jgi:hypothetical protein
MRPRGWQRVTQSVTLVAVLVIALVCGACARPAPFRPYEPGTFSADTGEAMYRAVYRAHQKGYVSEEDMDAYRRTYEEAQEAQHAFVTAVKRGEDTTAEKRALEWWVEQLLTLAYDAGVY